MSLTWFHHNYRKGRRGYGLAAQDAFVYAQQCRRLAAASYNDSVEHWIENTEDGAVLFLGTFIPFSSPEVHGCIGLGEDFEPNVDERGWVTVDIWEPHIVALADELLNEDREQVSA